MGRLRVPVVIRVVSYSLYSRVIHCLPDRRDSGKVIGWSRDATRPIAELAFGSCLRIRLLEAAMLRWAIGFFIVALIAALFGFGGIALAAAGIAKFIFYIFLVLFVLSLLAHLMRGTRV